MKVNQILADEQFLQTAQNLIMAAQKEIYILTFKVEINLKPRGRPLTKFFEQLFEKAKTGVNVRVITNRVHPRGHVPTSNLFAIAELKKHNIEVRGLRLDRICHAKLLIVDGIVAVLGSHNLSVKSCRNNFELSYISHDIEVVSHLNNIYYDAWENGVPL